MVDPKSAVLSDSVLEKLPHAETEDGGLPLCPRLRKVYLFPRGIEFSDKALVKLIAARRRLVIVNPVRIF